MSADGSALIYSALFGTPQSSADESGQGIAVDAAGNAYVTGYTSGSNFPTTVGAFDTTYNGGGHFGFNVFVTKLSADGSALVYSTFLGGGFGNGIAVDGSGNAYVTGGTDSLFPLTPEAFDTVRNNTGDILSAFVTKLTPDGSALAYSTLLESDRGREGDEGKSIAVDAAGNAYVTGRAAGPQPSFPSHTPFDGCHSDVFVTKLTADGSAVSFSTCLGGSASETGYGIALDAVGNVYVTGETESLDFPISDRAFQPVFAGVIDAFVAKLAIGEVGFLVSAILPSRGGNTGSVTALIHGGGFAEGATVKLARGGQPDIVGDPVTVTSDGLTITTTFNLNGKARGLWDVVVTNLDGTSATLPAGFTIEEGRAAQVWVDIVGRDAIRVGREQTFNIMYGNRGNVDAVGAFIWGPASQRTQNSSSALSLLQLHFQRGLTWNHPSSSRQRTT